MTLAHGSRGAALLFNLTNWRWAYDFDAPGVPLRARLQRLLLAVIEAKRCCVDARLIPELDYALSDCESLLALPALDAEAVERERVDQRIARIRRVVAHHEGTVARLNRRYWWLPFSILLAIMLLMFAGDLPRLFSSFGL